MRIRHLVVTAFCLAFAHVHAATLSVGPGEDTTSIGQALDQAQAGDVIEIRTGVYVEHLVVPDVGVEGAPLSIRAAKGERVVIDAHGAEYGIQIAPEAGWVALENLIVVRARSFGLYARPAHDLLVRGCTFARNGSAGLYVRYTDSITVERCRFHHNRINGASFNGVTGLTVSDCTSYLHPAAPGSSENFGIYVTNCEGGVIERNALFLNDKSGCRIVNSPNGNIVRDNCTHLNGWTGFDINSKSHEHLYVNNLMIHNMAHGINPKGYSREDRFVNNTIVGNRYSAVTVNNHAHDNFFRNNLLLGSPVGFSYDTRIAWDQRDSDHNIFDCDRPIAQLDSIEAAHELGLELHSLFQPVSFASEDPFDFRLPDDSPLHRVASDVGFGQVMGAPEPTWRGPRLLPVPIKVTDASGNLEEAQLTADGSAFTTWNSGVTEGAWIEYEVVGKLPGPLGFAVICPTISTALPDGDLPGPFTIRAGGADGEVLYDGELYVRHTGLARARGQCFELTRQTNSRRIRLELHRAVDGNYNGQIESICLTEVMLIAALDALPESLAEFPYDEVAPVSRAALEAARAAELRPTADMPDDAAADDAGLLLYVPFEDRGKAAYARGDGTMIADGAEFLPGVAGEGMYLSTLSGNTCRVAGGENLDEGAGTFSVFIKPLAPWNRETVGDQNFQFIMCAAYRVDGGWPWGKLRHAGGGEIRLAYVGGGFQVLGGVPYDGPPEFIIRKSVELEAGRWYHICLTWSKAANQMVLYLDAEEMSRAHFAGDFALEDRVISLGCYGASLQAMAVLDEVKVFDHALDGESVRELAAQLP